MSLRKFDVFPKLDNEFRIGTASGGVLSILSILATIILSSVEINSYLNPPTRQNLIVDSVRPTGPDGITITPEGLPKLDIKLNITFPQMPCYLMHFDVIDSVTQLPLPIDSIRSEFTRLNQQGEKIGVLEPHFLETPPGAPGSCYVGGDDTRCRSCQDVFAAYKSRSFRPPVLKEIDQCRPVVEKIQGMENEGCRISADFKAVRVMSEFHVSPGLSWFNEGWHVHDLRTYGKSFETINLTHTIHQLQFSKTDSKMPLDGFTNIQLEQKPWRTTYTVDILEDNFSVSRYAMYNPDVLSPGVVFKYDVSPIAAITYLDKEPLLHLVARLLTVIGGVLGLFRLIDSIMYMSSKRNAAEPKIE